MTVSDLLELSAGDVLRFDYPVERPVDLLVNGRLKFEGQVVSTGRKRAFEIQSFHKPVD